MIKALDLFGFDAACVVIADDGNLDLAAEHGFYQVERGNRYLGQKFNDGYAHAWQLGADLVCPLGSDSWLSGAAASLLATHAIEAGVVAFSTPYSVVREDGKERADLDVDTACGTTMVFPLGLLHRCGYRPIKEHAGRGCDTYTVNKLILAKAKLQRVSGTSIASTLALRSEQQITSYDRLVEKYAIKLTDRPWDGLGQIYGDDLVAKAQGLYA
jgi:hypothetical protein